MSMQTKELMVREIPLVLDVATSQMLHHEDPAVFEAPKDEIAARIEALNMAGQFEVAEGFLMAMAARSSHDSQKSHPEGGAVPAILMRDGEHSSQLGPVSRFFNRVFGY